MFNEDNQAESAGNIDEIIERENLRQAAWVGLIVALAALLFTGYNIARILTIRGEIGNRQIVTETLTRSYRYENKQAKHRVLVDYACYNAAVGEECLPADSAALGKKAGDSFETVRLWDGNVYYINTPYLKDLDFYLLWTLVATLILLVCLIKIIFPRFNILQKFNDTRTTKIFDK